MGNKLTEAQRRAVECPDCICDPDDTTLHQARCRRVARDAYLQCGPPWHDWPDVEPERVERKEPTS